MCITKHPGGDFIHKARRIFIYFQKKVLTTKIIFISGILGYLIWTFYFLFFGKIVVDEGFYLNASELVMQGKLPYQDFAFTQMPLVPYIYGIFGQIFGYRLWIGRLVSIFFSFLTLYLNLKIANKLGGKGAASITALLMGTGSVLIYQHLTVTTYSILALLLTGATYLLLLVKENDKYLLLITFLFLSASLVRLSAFFFTVLSVTYCLILAKNVKIRMMIIGEILIMGGLVYLLIMTNLEGATWGILSHHIDKWGDLSFLGKINEILTLRIPAITYYYLVYLPYFYLIFYLVMLNYKAIRNNIFKINEYWIIFVGIFLFILVHFYGGGLHVQYFFTPLLIMLPFISSSFVNTLKRTGISRLNVAGLIFTLVLVVIAGPLFSYNNPVTGNLLDDSNVILNYEIQRNQLLKYTNETSTLFIMDCLYLVPGSGREVYPKLTMSIFSVAEIKNEQAEVIGVITPEQILRLIENQKIEIIILAGYDWLVFEHVGIKNDVVLLLDTHYTLRNDPLEDSISYYVLKK